MRLRSIFHFAMEMARSPNDGNFPKKKEEKNLHANSINASFFWLELSLA